jgi:hypothetical protein
MFPTRVGGKSVRINDMRRGKISAKIVGIRLTIGRLLLFLIIPPEAGLLCFGVCSTSDAIATSLASAGKQSSS